MLYETTTCRRLITRTSVHLAYHQAGAELSGIKLAMNRLLIPFSHNYNGDTRKAVCKSLSSIIIDPTR